MNHALHSRYARICGHTITAVREMSTPPPPATGTSLTTTFRLDRRLFDASSPRVWPVRPHVPQGPFRETPPYRIGRVRRYPGLGCMRSRPVQVRGTARVVFCFLCPDHTLPVVRFSYAPAGRGGRGEGDRPPAGSCSFVHGLSPSYLRTWYCLTLLTLLSWYDIRSSSCTKKVMLLMAEVHHWFRGALYLPPPKNDFLSTVKSATRCLGYTKKLHTA